MLVFCDAWSSIRSEVRGYVFIVIGWSGTNQWPDSNHITKTATKKYWFKPKTTRCSFQWSQGLKGLMWFWFSEGLTRNAEKSGRQMFQNLFFCYVLNRPTFCLLSCIRTQNSDLVFQYKYLNIFLNQDTFTWEAKLHDFNSCFLKNLFKLSKKTRLNMHLLLR